MDNSFWARGTQMPEWPVKADGTREKAVLLGCSADSVADADMTVSLLAAYNIPCFKYYENEGAAGRVISGFSSFGAQLYVPASMLEDAQAILSADVEEENI